MVAGCLPSLYDENLQFSEKTNHLSPKDMTFIRSSFVQSCESDPALAPDRVPPDKHLEALYHIKICTFQFQKRQRNWIGNAKI